MPGTPDGGHTLILFGDVPLLTANTLSRLVTGTPEADMAVLTVDLDDPIGYGRVVRDGEDVVRIVEQKDASDDELGIREINTGVMLCPTDRLKSWLDRLGNDNVQGEYYLTDIIAMAVADGVTVHGIKADSPEEVMGINDKVQLAEAERALQWRRVSELMQAGVGFADPARVDIRGTLECGSDVFIDVNTIFEGNVVLGDSVTVESNNLVRDSRIGDETVIHSNCHIEGGTTGAGCEIGPFARMRPGAVLADRVKLGNFVEVKKSTVDDGSKVNHLTYIGDTEIGKGVNVGAGTITCNYDGANKHKTVIEDGAFIGSGVELVAPIRVGKNATIGAGSTLTKPAPDGQLTIERSKQLTVKSWQRPKKKI
jgi:bifunctional UDP-N-acetylglucosamine pyrophosphorylase/glucosamine-1-phosphate N-acetyltransferase